MNTFDASCEANRLISQKGGGADARARAYDLIKERIERELIWAEREKARGCIVIDPHEPILRVDYDAIRQDQSVLYEIERNIVYLDHQNDLEKRVCFDLKSAYIQHVSLTDIENDMRLMEAFYQYWYVILREESKIKKLKEGLVVCLRKKGEHDQNKTAIETCIRIIESAKDIRGLQDEICQYLNNDEEDCKLTSMLSMTFDIRLAQRKLTETIENYIASKSNCAPEDITLEKMNGKEDIERQYHALVRYLPESVNKADLLKDLDNQQGNALQKRNIAKELYKVLAYHRVQVIYFMADPDACYMKRLPVRVSDEIHPSGEPKKPLKKTVISRIVVALLRQHIDSKKKEIIIDLQKALSNPIGMLPMITEREEKSTKNPPKVIFKFGGRTLCEPYNCSQNSYNQLIQDLFEKKPSALTYLLIYLSLAIGRNLAILDSWGFSDIRSLLIESAKENEEKVFSTIKKIAENMYDCLKGVGNRIDSKPIEELEREGWNFVTEDRLSAYEIYNSSTIYAKKLEEEISQTPKPTEFLYFFRGKSVANNEAAKDVLKTISRIGVTVYQDNGYDQIKFSVSFSPIFEACRINIEENFLKMVRCDLGYKNFSVLDLKLFWGKQAQKARGTVDHAFGLSRQVGKKSRLEVTADRAMEEKIVQDALAARFIREDDGMYRFTQKYYRIFLDGFCTARELDRQFLQGGKRMRDGIVNAAVDQIFSFGKQQSGLDHLNLSLAEPSLFALSFLGEVNVVLREQIIDKIIEYANDYSVNDDGTSRLRQELAGHILCYLLCTAYDWFGMERQKDLLRAACSRQLYPGQIPLIEEAAKKNRFFELYPKECFAEALEIVQDRNDGRRYWMKDQPYFHLLQQVGEKAGRDKTDFLSICEMAQYESWKSKIGAPGQSRKVRRLLRQGYHDHIKKFTCEEFDVSLSKESAVRCILGSQLFLYALSNLVDFDKQENDDFMYQILKQKSEKRNEEHNDEDGKVSVIDTVLRITLWADYYQKKHNRLYCENDRSNMLLICGAYRLTSAYGLRLSSQSALISEDMLDQYVEWLHTESTAERYYWLQIRLLSRFVSLGDVVSLIAQKRGRSVEDVLKDMAVVYEETRFLRYDRMPVSFNAFCEEEGLKLKS